MGAWEYKLSDWVTVDEELTKRLMQVGVNCYRKLGGRSYPRVDMRVRDGEIWVLEINNNPGIDFHPDSAICHSAKMFGWDWHQLLDNIVTNARMERRMDDASVI
jgi:D-alanine-D-alanine ligase-like ATP-grasp enzyme